VRCVKSGWIFSEECPPSTCLSFFPLLNRKEDILKNVGNQTFDRRKKLIKVWNNMRVSKWWQDFQFCVNCPFKAALCWPPIPVRLLTRQEDALLIKINKTINNLCCVFDNILNGPLAIFSLIKFQHKFHQPIPQFYNPSSIVFK